MNKVAMLAAAAAIAAPSFSFAQEATPFVESNALVGGAPAAASLGTVGIAGAAAIAVTVIGIAVAASDGT